MPPDQVRAMKGRINGGENRTIRLVEDDDTGVAQLVRWARREAPALHPRELRSSLRGGSATVMIRR